MKIEQAKTATESRFSSELLAVLKEEPFRDPTLDAIRARLMTREQVIVWVGQASLVVREFTRFISAIHANCPHRDAQLLLAENLWEEHGKGIQARDHYALIKAMAHSLGATVEELDKTSPLPETTDYIAHCLQVTRNGSFIEGMTAIGIGIEYFSPRFFAALAELFRSQFGLSREEVEYLLVHVGEDEDHARRSLELIEKYADTDETKEKAKQALREMLSVKRRFAEALFAHCMNAG
ncbi:MAG: iron-containing redox enzyme family protein [Blastocatellia bacterium]